jgi:ABC-type transporter Mla maintaining outer membrane lipid asymmetry ATPase subunit MlaF
MKAAKAEAAPVLAFEGVGPAGGDAPPADAFHLALGPGDCVVFAGVDASSLHHLGDLVLGLQAPARGRILFGGSDWQTMDPRDVERCRRQTGRVLAVPGRAAWLQNLDVEENVQLARRFDPGSNVLQVRERSSVLCGLFGLAGLPGTRPASTAPDVLLRAQWVRAFLPDPLRLLVLESPDWGVKPSMGARLREQVRVARAAGTAVVWIDLGAAAGLGETMRYDGVPPALAQPT